ncbi:hypothetical protein GDO81_023456 [Engystomops pustulosus]|uniref:Uncharacterized protein n=1 Tax=Engystomops pustulosus TaxID=76066 RepID=A0AAV6YKK5_ENGPU|nr:hypothetical protein GDO81_023456 [Engystomops pustulosus]
MSHNWGVRSGVIWVETAAAPGTRRRNPSVCIGVQPGGPGAPSPTSGPGSSVTGPRSLPRWTQTPGPRP